MKGPWVAGDDDHADAADRLGGRLDGGPGQEDYHTSARDRRELRCSSGERRGGGGGGRERERARGCRCRPAQ
eukprot:415802-Rhodomonas_salina.1